MLLGSLQMDGSRRPGAIDKFHLDTQGIVEVVAEDMETKGHFEDAVKLYDLAQVLTVIHIKLLHYYMLHFLTAWLIVMLSIDQRSCTMLGPVSTGLSNCLCFPPLSFLGRLSLDIPVCRCNENQSKLMSKQAQHAMNCWVAPYLWSHNVS